MKRRKRRRTMRTPLDSATLSMHRFKRRATQPLCQNGLCTVHLHRPLTYPTAFSDSDKADDLECSHNGTHVTYTGPGQQEKDAASVRSDKSIPTSGIAIYYFEISILDAGTTGRIGVGLCDSNVKLEKMPGWDPGSYAYHGDDGMLFRQTGMAGTTYGPKYSTDDVIGCCWDLVQNRVFFTKNGQNLGVAFNSIHGELFPTIGMQSRQGKIKANFGQLPFAFDIESYAQQQRESVLRSLLCRTLPQDYRILSDTVLGYLIHNGYSKTAAAFAKDAGRDRMYQREHESMKRRQAVCEKVLTGDIDGAMADLERQFPQVLKTQLNMRFLLRTQKFIEMLVSGSSLDETVEYGRKELSVFRDKEYIEESEGGLVAKNERIVYDDVLRDVYLLLAYGNPAESPTGHLTKQSRREMVADRLNSAMLVSQGRAMQSVLEQFLCQMENILKHLLGLGNGAAALVSVHDLM